MITERTNNEGMGPKYIDPLPSDKSEKIKIQDNQAVENAENACAQCKQENKNYSKPIGKWSKDFKILYNSSLLNSKKRQNYYRNQNANFTRVEFGQEDKSKDEFLEITGIPPVGMKTPQMGVNRYN